jgi:polysaccharide deacetylase 2 family uncharacterized protein YibQ
MPKSLRIILLVILIVAPIIFYKSLNKKNSGQNLTLPLIESQAAFDRPKVALIFDDMGNSVQDLRGIYSLEIPLTISVIPNLKFSRNIAHVGARSGFSVLIDLPLEPLEKGANSNPKFISSDLGGWEIDSLLRRYLNFIRIAIGVNTHMGSRATQDRRLMEIISRELKRRNMVFIDSRTSSESVAYEVARQEGLICGYSDGLLDFTGSDDEVNQQLEDLISKAKDKGKIIAIVHSTTKAIDLFKSRLPELKHEIEFITIRDYFEL